MKEVEASTGYAIDTFKFLNATINAAKLRKYKKTPQNPKDINPNIFPEFQFSEASLTKTFPKVEQIAEKKIRIQL